MYPDGYNENFVGGLEDEQFLDSLTHLEREKEIDRRRRQREQMLQEAALLKSSNLVADPTYRSEVPAKQLFSGLKDDGDNEIVAKRVKTDKVNTRQAQERDALIIHPTEDLAKLNQICMKRTAILKQIDHFGFDIAARDCLVKVSLGTASEDNLSQYKIGLIQGIISRPTSPYKVDSVTTDKYLRVMFENGIENEIAIVNISNKEIDEREAFKLLNDLKQPGAAPLDTNWISRKQNDINEFLNKKYSLEDIIKIRERRLEAERAKPNRNLWSEKHMLEEQLNHLEAANFKQYDDERYYKIKQLRADLSAVISQIDAESQNAGGAATQRTKFDKFTDYKSVS